MQFLAGCTGFQCKWVCHADDFFFFFLVFLLRKQSVSCGNLQRRTPVLGFGRKMLFHARQGESLTGHAGEKAGLSGGLGSSREDCLSVLPFFSYFRGARLLQEQGERLLSWLPWKAVAVELCQRRRQATRLAWTVVFRGITQTKAKRAHT